MVAWTFLALGGLSSLEDGNNTHLRRNNYKSHRKRNKIYACRGDSNSHRVTTNQLTIRQLVLQASSSHRVDQTSEEKHRLTYTRRAHDSNKSTGSRNYGRYAGYH